MTSLDAPDRLRRTGVAGKMAGRTPEVHPAMLAAIVCLAAFAPAAPPIRLHPDNPRYFDFRGKPTVLVTSGEHYGAVLNLDFDFVPYLEELKARGLNLTRTFSGTYREVPGSFNIRDNTLAPKPGRYQPPWVRVSRPGEPEKYDLDRFDPAYFERLKAFLTAAGQRGVVVELVLFCPFYEPVLWEIDPMNARNNVNGVGDVPREKALTLDNGGLLEKQLALVRKIVAELKDFDNLYYEICNEPYFVGVTLDWQRRVAATIAEAENGSPHRHLIAQNIANNKAVIQDPDPNVSIFNFHYASPPDTVGMNWDLNKPIAFDETGFQGTADRTYRRQGWEFLLAGGSVFSNLDYSFTPEHEDGTARVEDPTPGGGSRALREQLGFLRRFVEGFDFLRMKPDRAVVKVAGGIDANTPLYALVEPGKQYAVYVPVGPRVELTIELPAGRYTAEWIDAASGRSLSRQAVESSGGTVTLRSPDYPEDAALRVAARP
jgi:hypothetical protein